MGSIVTLGFSFENSNNNLNFFIELLLQKLNYIDEILIDHLENESWKKEFFKLFSKEKLNWILTTQNFKIKFKAKINDNILNVSLLIIDDLGTETMNSMKFTEIYKVINTRLLNQNGKITKTIISTNLDLQGLFNTYDERIVSRFIGNYNIYRFFGDDIRFKK